MAVMVTDCVRVGSRAFATCRIPFPLVNVPSPLPRSTSRVDARSIGFLRETSSPCLSEARCIFSLSILLRNYSIFGRCKFQGDWQRGGRMEGGVEKLILRKRNGRNFSIPGETLENYIEDISLSIWFSNKREESRVICKNYQTSRVRVYRRIPNINLLLNFKKLCQKETSFFLFLFTFLLPANVYSLSRNTISRRELSPTIRNRRYKIHLRNITFVTRSYGVKLNWDRLKIN